MIEAYDLNQKFNLKPPNQNNKVFTPSIEHTVDVLVTINDSRETFLELLLNLPVVGQFTGTYLVARLLLFTECKKDSFEKDIPIYKNLIELIC